MKTYEYYINIDERGEFCSDVRDENNKTIAEFRCVEEFREDGFGDLRSINDVNEYLISIGILKSDDNLVWG